MITMRIWDIFESLVSKEEKHNYIIKVMEKKAGRAGWRILSLGIRKDYKKLFVARWSAVGVNKIPM